MKFLKLDPFKTTASQSATRQDFYHSTTLISFSAELFKSGLVCVLWVTSLCLTVGMSALHKTELDVFQIVLLLTHLSTE